jgi:carboxyl-terminal processing protease
MKRFRVALLVASVSIIVLFAGLLTAGLTTKESLFQALGNLAEVVHLVEAEYVDELDPDVLALSLDAGILQSVDPWAAVVTDEQVGPYTRVLADPPPYGLGLSLRLGSAAVRSVFPGSPADEAGLESWEVIEKIDGVYTRGQPLWQIALDLHERQTRGESVSLTVMDRQVDDRRDVVLSPMVWEPVSATAEDSETVRIITVNSLTTGASTSIEGLIPEQGTVVLDLRGLVWGVEDEALAVADLFIGEGTIAQWEGREAEGEIIEATAASGTNLPTVLIDSETEGVGEVLAAALQRSGSVLVGVTTMGHAPHMQIVRSGGLNLYIPVGRWLAPDGEPIKGEGLTPDEEVEPPDDEEGGDPMLDRALELAVGELAEAA